MKFTILDGAMGTMLHAAGLDPALPSDTWNTTHPERLTAIHAQYAAAGSEVLLANTFCSNRLNLAKTGRDVAETVEGAVLDVSRDYDQLRILLMDHLDYGDYLLKLGYLLVNDKDIGVFQYSLTCGGVGYHIVGDEALLDLHAAHAVHIVFRTVGVFDCHDTIVTGARHCVHDHIADLFVSAGDLCHKAHFLFSADLH